MAEHPVYVRVTYLDAAEREATIRYLLERKYDDVANNWAALKADVLDLESQLGDLTMAQILPVVMEVEVGAGTGAANIASNNQVRAFSRCVDINGEKCSFEVPSWDDITYDQDSNNLLSTAYNTEADEVRNLLANPETGDSMASLSWSQSRTRKSRNVLT